MSNPTTVRLAQRLVDLAPPGLAHVFFSSDGSSAVEVALKMAFQYWQQRPDPRPGKTQYLAFGDAYHGDTLGSVSVGGVARFHAMFRPLLFDVLRLPAPDCYRLPRGVTPRGRLPALPAAAGTDALALHHAELAAVVIEPLLQAAAGMIAHPAGYLRGVRELTRRYGVLLIADEVAVGFGRTGTLFACQQESVTPDLLCLGKGLTGGYLPMAATLATDEIWQAFLGGYAESKTFFHGHTYGGNPLAAAVALATLEVFDDEQTLARLPPKVQLLAEQLGALARHPHVGDVRQRGLMAGIELVRDRPTQEPYPWPEQRGLRVCELRPRARRLAAAAGECRRHHAAAGDFPAGPGSHPGRRGGRHRRGHPLMRRLRRDPIHHRPESARPEAAAAAWCNSDAGVPAWLQDYVKIHGEGLG